jgi:hypothetical protein
VASGRLELPRALNGCGTGLALSNDFPQRLKAISICAKSGMVETMPFQSGEFFRSM